MTKKQQQISQIKTVFDQFDLDKSGFIDFNQLKQVTKQLGQEISDQQLKILTAEVDSNKDGKISYSQFQTWWLKGRKNKLNDIIALKIKAMEAIKGIKENFKSKGLSLKNMKPSSKLDSALININFGTNKSQLVPDTTSINAGYFYTENVQQTIGKSLYIQQPFLEKDRLSLAIKFPTNEPEKLANILKNVIKQRISQITQKLKQATIELPPNFQNLIDQTGILFNNFFKIKMLPNTAKKYLLFCFTPGEEMGEVFNKMIEPKDKFLKKMGQNFHAKIQLGFTLNTTFSEILKSNKSLIEILMQGCSFGIQTTMSSEGFKLIKKFIAPPSQIQGPQALLFYLIKNLKIQLNIKTPQDLQNFFQKLGISDLVKQLPTIHDILGFVNPEIEMANRLFQEGQPNAPPFFDLIIFVLNIMSTLVNPGLTIVLGNHKYAVFVELDGQGLEDLLKGLNIKMSAEQIQKKASETVQERLKKKFQQKISKIIEQGEIFGQTNQQLLQLIQQVPQFKNVTTIYGLTDTVNDEVMTSLIDNSNKFPDLLYLIFNQEIITEQGLLALKASNVNFNNLLTLGLNKNAIKDQGLGLISHNAHKMPNLQNLYLDQNQISDVGFEALAECKQKLPNLTQIYLSDNQISDAGLRAFAQKDGSLLKLKYFVMSNNKISDVGIKSFAANSHKYPNLTNLQLGFNSISDQGLRAIIENANNFENIQEILLNKNSITDDGVKLLIENGTNLKNLQTISFYQNDKITIACQNLANNSNLTFNINF